MKKNRSYLMTVMIGLAVLLLPGTVHSIDLKNSNVITPSFAQEALNQVVKQLGQFDPKLKCCLKLVDFQRTIYYSTPTYSLVHYVLTLKVGTGEWDKIRIHRLVKEEKPGVPKKNLEGVFLIHGDLAGFESAFLFAKSSGVKPALDAIAAFFANNNLDVWGIDLRWTQVPPTVTDFSFMQKWGTDTYIADIEKGLKAARIIRGLSGSGFNKIFLLGWSRGGQLAYSLANKQTQYPNWMKDIKGMIPLEIAYKYDPKNNADLIQLSQGQYEAMKAQFDQGGNFSNLGYLFSGIVGLGLQAPDQNSQIPGLEMFTNKNVADLAFGATYVVLAPSVITPTFHWVSSQLMDLGQIQLPVAFNYSNYDYVMQFGLTFAPFQSFLEQVEGEQILGDIDNRFDKNLSKIDFPVFYVGAAGGYGSLGLYTLSLLGGSTESLIISSTNDGLSDYGHADVLLADNAKDQVWAPILQWVKRHA